MFRNFLEFFRGEEELQLETSPESRTRDLYVTAAVLLSEHALLDRELTPPEIAEVVKLMESKFHLKQFITMDSLELADLAVANPQRVDQLLAFIRDKFTVEDRQEIMKLVWQAIVADNRIEEPEKDFASELREKLGLSIEQAVDACMAAEASS